MKKNILSIFAMLVAVLGLTAVLAGCGPVDKSDNNPPTEPVAQTQTPPPAEEVDVDQEIKNLDASMDSVKETGFTDADLSDKDLGI